jgi:hypothetical protein
MATAKTIQAIRADMEGNGISIVPFATVERILGQAYPDDNSFEAAISQLVSTVDWVTSFEIDWINRYVKFSGPWTETDN